MRFARAIAALTRPARISIGACGVGATLAASLILFPSALSAITPANLPVGGSIFYTFNTPGTLMQAASSTQSSSPYWWLQSGGKLIITGGIGETIQGALPATSSLRIALKSSVSADLGAHPQNAFLLLSREPVENTSVQVYLDRTADNLSNVANREPYEGEDLLARYQDANDYYYAGIRADGEAVIKKKTNGVYQTLASVKLFPGTYSTSTDPDLIPLNKWIGMKFVVDTSSAGVTQLSFYTDLGDTGVWKLALTASDTPSTYGPAITAAGVTGIESDYADAQFDNFRVSDLGANPAASSSSPSSAPPNPPAPSTTTPVSKSPESYDSIILSDHPVLYLPMSSPSSGVEKDESGNGLNGTYKGGAPKTATLPDGETAADFNGTSEYLTVPSAPSLSIPTTGELTWEGWIRPDTYQFPDESSDGYVDWMGKCEDYSPSCEWEARIYGSSTSQGRPDRLSAYVFNSSAGLGSAADWQPSANLEAGQWIYVVAEYQTQTTLSGCSSSDPGTINIWVDGVKQDFAEHAPTGCMSQYGIKPKAGDSPLTIGTMALDTFFEGAIGKVAVYDTLLSQSQIDAHYEAMTGTAVAGSCGVTCTISSLPQ